MRKTQEDTQMKAAISNKYSLIFMLYMMDNRNGRKSKNKKVEHCSIMNVINTNCENASIEDHNYSNNKNEGNIDNNIIPTEIDIHFQMYGKHAWEVEYGYRCPICEKRIDELGYCACGGQGE
jgi:hypothetical protein